ncbi:MAG: cbb3-type cytochrome c oxidase subunit I [Longimicrobiales bacterium]
MYTLVRRFIKTGVGFLFAGLGLGAYMMVRRDILGIHPHPHLVSAHTHAVFSGFVLFLILGVALWLFPRAPKDDARYSPGRAEASYWILVVATALRVAAEATRSVADPPGLGWAIVVGGLGQIAGLGLYFWTLWPRIRPVGSHLREARGERF